MLNGRKSSLNQPGRHNIDYHQRNCTICKHPYRHAIEEEFLRWRCPHDIAADFKINFRSIYRHAHATGLYGLRRRNLRCVLEPFLERSEHVAPSATEVISAVRAYARINDDGAWVEPTTTNKILVERVDAPARHALAPVQVEEGVLATARMLPAREVAGVQDPLPGDANPPIDVVVAASEAGDDPTQADNEIQTDTDLTR